MARAKAAAVWALILAVMTVPIVIAAGSPLLQWRSAVYIVAGFAGIFALALLLVQPILAAGALPGLSALRARRIHRWVGAALVGAIVVHVGGLWLTSPPDVVDALLFVSPTPFAAWGVIAMWAAFAAALMALLRKRVRLRPQTWRLAHTTLAVVVVGGTVLHALLIEGAMGPVSKAALCGIVALALAKTVYDRRTFHAFLRKKA